MYRKLASLGIIVFGICSFSLPKVLAQSNYWVNSDNGKDEFLDQRLHVVTQHAREAEGQNGNRADTGDHRDTSKIARSRNGGSRSGGSRGSSVVIIHGY